MAKCVICVQTWLLTQVVESRNPVPAVYRCRRRVTASNECHTKYRYSDQIQCRARTLNRNGPHLHQRD